MYFGCVVRMKTKNSISKLYYYISSIMVNSLKIKQKINTKTKKKLKENMKQKLFYIENILVKT